MCSAESPYRSKNKDHSSVKKGRPLGADGDDHKDEDLSDDERMFICEEGETEDFMGRWPCQLLQICMTNFALR